MVLEAEFPVELVVVVKPEWVAGSRVLEATALGSALTSEVAVPLEVEFPPELPVPTSPEETVSRRW